MRLSDILKGECFYASVLFALILFGHCHHLLQNKKQQAIPVVETATWGLIVAFPRCGVLPRSMQFHRL